MGWLEKIGLAGRTPPLGGWGVQGAGGGAGGGVPKTKIFSSLALRAGEENFWDKKIPKFSRKPSKNSIFEAKKGHFFKIFGASRRAAKLYFLPNRGGRGVGWPKRLLAGKIGLAGWTPPGGGGPRTSRKALVWGCLGLTFWSTAVIYSKNFHATVRAGWKCLLYYYCLNEKT